MKWLGALLMTLLLPAHCIAGEIRIDLEVRSQDDIVFLAVSNHGSKVLEGVRAAVELAGRRYETSFEARIEPRGRGQRSLRVALPPHSGSYPLKTTVFYLQDGREMSVVNAGLFTHRRQLELPTGCPKLTIRMRAERTVSIPKLTSKVSLVVPEEVIVASNVLSDSVEFYLSNTRPMYSATSTAFLLLEEPGPASHAAKICQGTLIRTKSPGAYSIFPTWLIGMLGAAALLLSGLLFAGVERKRVVRYRARVASRSLFTLAIICLCLLLSRVAGVIPEYSLERLHALQPTLGRHLVAALTSQLRWFYFEGTDFDYFFQYLADPLLVYFAVANWMVVAWLIKPEPETDRWWALMRRFFTPLSRGSEETAAAARVALLGFCVKLFYVPLLWSWTINNLFHEQRLAEEMQWTFAGVNELAIATLILIDVGVFALSYLIELPQLKNGIRTVEATALGWFVCLLCYPPLNQLTYHLLDHPFRVTLPPAGGYVGFAAEISVTALWVIYVAATVALGFKSSNLTNRGIVSRGPYAFVRHPAYASKLTIWFIFFFFLGRMNGTLAVGLVIIYVLRAWTEERHLSGDPEYMAYRERVPWRFIPRVY